MSQVCQVFHKAPIQSAAHEVCVQSAAGVCFAEPVEIFVYHHK